MEELQAILGVAESVTLICYMLASVWYVDGLRKEEKSEVDDRTQDIIDDWKRMRQLED